MCQPALPLQGAVRNDTTKRSLHRVCTRLLKYLERGRVSYWLLLCIGFCARFSKLSMPGKSSLFPPPHYPSQGGQVLRVPGPTAYPRNHGDRQQRQAPLPMRSNSNAGDLCGAAGSCLSTHPSEPSARGTGPHTENSTPERRDRREVPQAGP